MKHLKIVMCVVALTQFASGEALAWGKAGHRLVADIAERHLTVPAREMVQQLLATEGHRSMADVANWADLVAKLTIPVPPKHVAYMPGDNSPYDAVRDCPNNNCVIAAIDADVKALRQTVPVDAQEQALKYLIHFVGDIHMPLHPTELGRGRTVTYRGKTMTLHVLWDTFPHIDGKLSERNLVAEVEADNTYVDPQDLSPVNWAMETRDVARDHVVLGDLLVKSKDPLVLPDDYKRQNWALAKKQFKRAGYRLAFLLNAIAGNGFRKGSEDVESPE